LKLIIQIFVLIVTVSSILYSQSWQLVWSDEFDAVTLDETSWTREVGWNGGWGNNELQYYTNRNENSFLENGNLIIEALKENYGGREYTSARLKTQNKKFFKYGKIEANIKLPYGQGIWPAFWMLGQNISSVGWPACGEIDIMEMIGGVNNDNTAYGTAHWENEGQHLQSGGNYSLNTGIFADDFHKFTIIWDHQFIRWYIDDNLYYTFSVIPFDRTEFHKEFFIILNIAVGGNWPGPPNLSTIFPQRMEVDYVRVYQQLTDAETELNSPIQFNLFQNYPNPFNPETKIKYSLPINSHISIDLFNVLGEKVAELVNDEKQSGYHELVFNANNYPSGIYIYKIQAGNLKTVSSNDEMNPKQYFEQSKKMILLK